MRKIEFKTNHRLGREEVVKHFGGDYYLGGVRARLLLNLGIASSPRLYDCDEKEGSDEITLVIERIHGERLDEINFENLSRIEKIDLARMIAYAIYDFHRAGHWIGDVSEENIIISDDRAVIIDLSTTLHPHQGPETKLEYITPEMNPDHPSPPVGRHVDVSNLGTILGKIDGDIFSRIIVKATHPAPERRPSAKKILEWIEKIQIETKFGQEKSQYKKRLLSSVLSGIFALAFFLAFSGMVQIGAQKSSLSPIESRREAWVLRKGWASKTPRDRLDIATHISLSNNEMHTLNAFTLEAVFATETPLLVVSGRPLGPGDLVRLQRGGSGFIANIRLEKIEIQTSAGIEIFETDIYKNGAGFCTSNKTSKGKKDRIAIWSTGKNLAEIITCVAEAADFNLVTVSDGYIAGIFNEKKLEEWLSNYSGDFNIEINGSDLTKVADLDAKIYPVKNFLFGASKDSYEKGFGLPVSGDLSYFEEVYLGRGKVSSVLKYLDLTYEISGGVVKITKGENQ